MTLLLYGEVAESNEHKPSVNYYDEDEERRRELEIKAYSLSIQILSDTFETLDINTNGDMISKSEAKRLIAQLAVGVCLSLYLFDQKDDLIDILPLWTPILREMNICCHPIFQ